jgi:hypothetical protein
VRFNPTIEVQLVALTRLVEQEDLQMEIFHVVHVQLLNAIVDVLHGVQMLHADAVRLIG